MSHKKRLERIENITPKQLKQGYDLSGLSDEELSILEAAHSKKSFTQEEEAEINGIMAKVPGRNP